MKTYQDLTQQKKNKMEYKQVIVVINSLKLPKGKLAAQCAHAAVEATLRSEKDLVKKWRAQGMKKVVLKVESEKEIYALKQEAEGKSIKTAIITDAGKTVVAPGTTTCIGIGPGEEKEIDEITGNLKMI